jgi:hypothetical protein
LEAKTVGKCRHQRERSPTGDGPDAVFSWNRRSPLLDDADWDLLLRGTQDEAKACLKTVEGMRWTMAKEEKAAKVQRRPPTVSDPTGLF